MKYKHYNEQTDTETTWQVSYEYNKFIKGRYYGEPGDCYPDEGGDVYDIEVKENGVDITSTLSAKVLSDIEGACYDDLALQAVAYEPDYD